jgi:Ni/Co efflux regulator RcnB
MLWRKVIMKTFLAAAVSLSLIAGSIAPVYAHDRDGDRDHDRREWNNDGRGNDGRGNDRRDDRHDSRYDSRRENDRHDDARHYRSGYVEGRRDQYGYDAGRYVTPRGYVGRAWHRGDYLPRTYYSTRYVVNDYGSYHLYAPPRGHHWVRVNHDVLLTAVATGAVVAVVANLFH